MVWCLACRQIAAGLAACLAIGPQAISEFKLTFSQPQSISWSQDAAAASVLDVGIDHRGANIPTQSSSRMRPISQLFSNMEPEGEDPVWALSTALCLPAG
jgi:hypothetical protein